MAGRAVLGSESPAKYIVLRSKRTMANMSVLSRARAASTSRDTGGQRVPAARCRRPLGRLSSRLPRWGPACGAAAHAMAVHRSARSSAPRRAIFARPLAGRPSRLQCTDQILHALHGRTVTTRRCRACPRAAPLLHERPSTRITIGHYPSFAVQPIE